MTKIVSSSEAKSHFSELIKWATENQDKVIVKLYGNPTVVIVSYKEFEEIEKLRKQEIKRQALIALQALRQEARRQNPDIAAEEAYRLAGFSEEVIQDTLRADQELANC